MQSDRKKLNATKRNSRLPSKLSYLATSNNAPQQAETMIIQNEITGLTEDIEGLESKLQELKQWRREYRSLISPLRRIPPEILGQVFIWALPTSDLEDVRSIENDQIGRAHV